MKEFIKQTYEKAYGSQWRFVLATAVVEALVVLVIGLVLSITLLLTGCAPEQGPRGATGKQGVAGTDGIDGQAAPSQADAIVALQAKVAQLELDVTELQERKCKRGKK